jgi:leader peptidase (prepilin peptidase)/N-methyltransferase
MIATLMLMVSPAVGWALGRLSLALTGVDIPIRWLAPGAVLAAAFCLFASQQPLAISLALAWSLLLLASIDVRVMRLPDVLTLPLAAAGLGVALWRGDQPLAHALGAVAGFLLFAGLDRIYIWLRGRSGLGLGDAKLFCAAGAWLGWRLLPAVLLVASAAGLAWFAVLIPIKGLAAARRPIAFGAPLCLAILIIWGET